MFPITVNSHNDGSFLNWYPCQRHVFLIQSHMNGAKKDDGDPQVSILGGVSIKGVSKKREVTVHTRHTVIQRNNIMGLAVV